MKKLILVFIALCTCSINLAYAYHPGPIVRERITPTTLAQQNEQTVVDMLYWLHQAMSENRQISQAEINHFFNKNAAYTINDQNLLKSNIDYWHAMNSLSSHIANVKDKIHEVVADNNHVFVWYDVSLTLKNGITTPLVIMSMFTLKNHKIVRWVKVINSHIAF